MQSSDNPDFQQSLFDRLIGAHGKQKVIQRLCAAWGVSPGSVYNRLNGTTVLTLPEYSSLCAAFGMSPSGQFPQEKGTVSFVFNALRQPVRNFQDYLAPLLRFVETAAASRKSRLLFSTAEIPIFHYFYFRELTLFKLYCWGRSVWDLAHLRQTPFNPDTLAEATVFENFAMPILRHYNHLDTTEFWNGNIYDNTLNQIRYFAFSGDISPNIKSLLLLQMRQLHSHQYNMAEIGRKARTDGSPSEIMGKFDLFVNEINHTSNTFLMDSPEFKATFAVYNNPNYMFSTDPELFEFTANWFETLRRKSTPITRDFEAGRRHFFNGLSQRFEP